ncbi:hypothetical protein [Bacillus sp. MUM 13]|nr:hypothetical protein [Bacillus sp. MUM 13]
MFLLWIAGFLAAVICVIGVDNYIHKKSNSHFEDVDKGIKNATSA